MGQYLSDVWSTTVVTLPSGGFITLGQIILVLSLLLFGYLISRFFGFLLGRKLATTKLKPDAIHVLKRIVFFAILILVAMTALSLLGIPLTAFAFATGAIAIGVGFGAQNIINNFISGWILMAERPIRINDFIEIDGAHGTIERINTRSTRIRRVDGVHLLVPNSLLLEKTVTNWTLIDKQIRSTIRVGVAYGSPVHDVERLIGEAVKQQPEVKSKPAPIVVFEDFGDNALIFDTYFWCDVAGEKELRQIRSEIRFRISDLFETNDITIAFPQRDVHLDVESPIAIHLLNSKETSS